MTRMFRLWMKVGVGLMLAGGGWAEESGGGPPGMPPPLVEVAEVQPEDLVIEAEYPARVRGMREVEVRARVGGLLLERSFAEGAVVEEGDVLFRIEPDAYEIALAAARAELENAEAVWRQAEREWERVSTLYETSALSARDRDRALSEYELAQAGVRVAESRVARADLDLRYTEVRAPLSGLVGLEKLSEGNLVEPGTLLTRLVQVDPVQVRFSLPEAAFAERRRSLAEGGLDEERAAVVSVVMEGDEVVPGVLDFVDSVVDPDTGAVAARAVFSNEEGLLVPGRFVRVRVPLRGLEGVFVVPPKALGQGAGGPRVFVLGEDGLVREREVEAGPLVEEGRVVIGGLSAGERVVTSGQVMLRDGMPAQVAEERGEKGSGNGGEGAAREGDAGMMDDQMGEETEGGE